MKNEAEKKNKTLCQFFFHFLKVKEIILNINIKFFLLCNDKYINNEHE